MICPACGAETKGLNHNNRGLRCTNCWELLPVEEEKPGVEAKETPKPAPKKKAAK